MISTGSTQPTHVPESDHATLLRPLTGRPRLPGPSSSSPLPNRSSLALCMRATHLIDDSYCTRVRQSSIVVTPKGSCAHPFHSLALSRTLHPFLCFSRRRSQGQRHHLTTSREPMTLPRSSTLGAASILANPSFWRPLSHPDHLHRLPVQWPRPCELARDSMNLCPHHLVL